MFELSRIEDLIVRIVYEYFGKNFIALDPDKPDWEQQLTWDKMKDALNKRGKPQQQTHPELTRMPEPDYQKLMGWIRKYRSPEILALTNYRDRRTHRVTPTVDHPELGVSVQSLDGLPPGEPTVVLMRRTKAEFDLMSLYTLSTKVYKQKQVNRRDDHLRTMNT